ncbi:MAG: M1 family metallopeptidase, partial [Candidatus Saccharimonadales bacterium]
MSKKVRRLFEQFHPVNYHLELRVDPDEMIFDGKVTIAGQKVGRPSQRITLHQKGLKIAEAKITKHDKSGDQIITISRINTQKTYDEVRLHSKQMIYSGNYTLELKFSGNVTRNMEGIYPSFFKHAGKDQKIISTQFESHHAREAFPCIDEPEAKATFDLTLVSEKGMTVLGNT